MREGVSEGGGREGRVGERGGGRVGRTNGERVREREGGRER